MTHCHLCFKRVVAPVPGKCNSCTIIIYCSIDCRNRDSDIHKIECSILLALYVSSASVTCFLALKSVSQKALKEMMKMKNYLNDDNKDLEIKPWKADDYRCLHRLGKIYRKYKLLLLSVYII